MGLKLKQTLVKENGFPGPGTYQSTRDSLKRKAGPAFGFSKSKRPPIGHTSMGELPGPGQYKLVSKIANCPDYALPSIKPEYRFV